MLFVLARSNRRHLHVYFNNSACFVPCQQTILGAAAEFAFSLHNPCFQNLTPTEFMQSLLRACRLTARRYKAPWAFQTQLYISPAISHGSHLSCFYLTQRCTSDATVFARRMCLHFFRGRETQDIFLVCHNHRLELLQPSVVTVMAAFPVAVVSQSSLTRPCARVHKCMYAVKELLSTHRRISAQSANMRSTLTVQPSKSSTAKRPPLDVLDTFFVMQPIKGFNAHLGNIKRLTFPEGRFTSVNPLFCKL